MSYHTFEAVTPLSQKEVVEKLEDSLTEIDWLGKPKNLKPFSGIVSSSDFTFTRILWGRNSLIPIIYGHFWSANQYTHVSVRMTFHPTMRAGLVVISVFLSGSLLMTVLDHGGSDPRFFVLSLLLPWLAGIPLFYYNASKSKQLLQEILGLAEVPKDGG